MKDGIFIFWFENKLCYNIIIMSAIDEKLQDLHNQADGIDQITSRSVLVLKKHIQQGKTTLNDLDKAIDFFPAIAFLNAQAKSPKIDNFIQKKTGQKPISSSLGRGDGYDTATNKYYEYKISTSNKDNKINAVQLRPWQKIDFYLLGYIDEKNFNNSRLYLLTHQQLIDECNSMNVGAMHGTAIANQQNQNVELALRLPIDNNNLNFQRFEKNYRAFNLENIIFERWK